ncbi:hypothetical protein EWM64_g8402 [Hericium alpestre]|uniref:Uncharacterized protein n=1 Tax=Hericium alpestre TaxID=135208 RepID=A0A4Y9ZMY7_9AGAM|nr:hypothetical protein EWM64_g8402 [Hericium alpestre]
MPIKTRSKSKVKHAHPSTDEDSPQAPKKKAGAQKLQAQCQAEQEAKEAAEQQAAKQIVSFEEATVAANADAAKDAAWPRSQGNTTKVLRVVIECPALYLRTTRKVARVEQDVGGDGEGEDDAAGNSPDDMVIDEGQLYFADIQTIYSQVNFDRGPCDAHKDSENVGQELPEQSSTESNLSGDEDNPVQVPMWMESQIVMRREEEEESGGEEAGGEQMSRLKKDIKEIGRDINEIRAEDRRREARWENEHEHDHDSNSDSNVDPIDNDFEDGDILMADEDTEMGLDSSWRQQKPKRKLADRKGKGKTKAKLNKGKGKDKSKSFREAVHKIKEHVGREAGASEAAPIRNISVNR